MVHIVKKGGEGPNGPITFELPRCRWIMGGRRGGGRGGVNGIEECPNKHQRQYLNPTLLKTNINQKNNSMEQMEDTWAITQKATPLVHIDPT
jgi:hypothetical protein